MNSPTKGIKPSEDILKRVGSALAVYLEYPPEAWGSFEGEINAVFASIPDPLAVIDKICIRLESYRTEFEPNYNEAMEILAAAEHFKKEWSGQS